MWISQSSCVSTGIGSPVRQCMTCVDRDLIPAVRYCVAIVDVVLTADLVHYDHVDVPLQL